MKKYALNGLMTAAFLSAFIQVSAAEVSKVGIVNFKNCVENSKVGKQEQTLFESLKKKAEETMQKKEKEISELAGKLQDTDYIEGLSQEAAADLKYKYKTMSQEILQEQQQLYQSLSQANFKIVQKLTEDVNKAAKIVAEKNNLDLVLNDEACFYSDKKLEISRLIVQEMDAALDKGAQELQK